MKMLKYLLRLPVLVGVYVVLAFLFFISNYGMLLLITKLQEQYSFKWLDEMLYYVNLVLNHFWIGAVIGLVLIVAGWFMLVNLGMTAKERENFFSDETQDENNDTEGRNLPKM